MLGLYRVAIAVVGALVALTQTFPSVRVADVLAIFGGGAPGALTIALIRGVVARDQAVEAVLTAYRENKIPMAVSEPRIIPASSTTDKPEGA